MKSAEPNKRQIGNAALLFTIVFAALWMGQFLSGPNSRVSWSELTEAVRDHRIESLVVTPTEVRAKAGTSQPDLKDITAERLPGVELGPFLAEAEDYGVVLEGRGGGSGFGGLLVWMGPMILFSLVLGVPLFLYRRAQQERMNFGRGKTQVFEPSDADRVTFADVAGVDQAKEELREVIDFLKHPDRYRAMGAHLPKGTLLVGAPGTGKTLLAKAVAGEAEVPFFAISGSEFVEMFVGVGASRVRGLFEKAREHAPCIVFIDELDAIGKARSGVSAMGGNDEREQTLNQLLVEMDGFDTGTGVVIMAATNRPEVIDQALQRAGRFDRKVILDHPDINDREAILAVHVRHVTLGEVDLRMVARRTVGMVGADLARVVNEAALAAVRREAAAIVQVDFEEAVDRIQLGLERPRAMSEDEKLRIAYHESGHTLVALSVEHADPVHRVTVVPRTIGSLGLTLQLPTADRYLVTEPELLDQITVLLGGRAAEETALGSVSSGAENDLDRATAIARKMICRFGMSEELGTGTWGDPGTRYLNAPGMGSLSRETSEQTAETVDREVRRILSERYQLAKKILKSHRAALDALADRLQQDETLDGDQIEAVVRNAGGRDAPPNDSH